MQTRKNKLTTIGSFLIMIGLLASCHNSNDDNPNPNNATPAAGQWKVSHFFDKQDETGNYSAYVFEFDTNGNISVSNGNQVWAGSWSSGFDDSTNKFLISFSGTVPSALADLEEDWRIIEMRDDFMHFEHTSGGNGDTDVLKFTKN